MTIYDIAKLAGVSASTVSRVINEKPGIKESTRQRVKQLLEQYNYTPDEIIDRIVDDIHSSEPMKENGSVYYPGERTILTREENMTNGIPVLEDVWERIQALKK